MKRRSILLFALSGIAGISIGGSLFGLVGVAALFIAVWAIVENGRLADWDHDIRKAYPEHMAQPRTARPHVRMLPAPQLVSVLS